MNYIIINKTRNLHPHFIQDQIHSSKLHDFSENNTVQFTCKAATQS